MIPAGDIKEFYVFTAVELDRIIDKLFNPRSQPSCVNLTYYYRAFSPSWIVVIISLLFSILLVEM